ncbi:MAG: CRTAC1 family protein, partial [Deltaproteobacteria bacterium]|nr:CRTAC1 family protein [Deltaproteobacteria bacterium]
DVNNDGHIDLLTTEIVHWDVGSSSDPSELLFNDGGVDVVFARPGNEQTGLLREHIPGWNDGDMSAAVFDFDNDGWPDVYIGASDYPGNRGLLFHQRPALPGTFEPVPVEDSFEHNRSHGVVAADLDRDGDLDMVVGHSHARCDPVQPNDCYPTQAIRVFRNVLGQDGNWLQLDLEGGEGCNRSAIGARVTVAAGGITQTQEVDGGHGHYGIQREHVLHFGLGTACEAEVTVRWPDGPLTTETFTLPAGHRFHWRQGEVPGAVTP